MENRTVKRHSVVKEVVPCHALGSEEVLGRDIGSRTPALLHSGWIMLNTVGSRRGIHIYIVVYARSCMYSASDMS